MTMPEERQRRIDTLIATMEVLAGVRVSISDGGAKIKLPPKEVRAMAQWWLRHAPYDREIKEAFALLDAKRALTNATLDPETGERKFRNDITLHDLGVKLSRVSRGSKAHHKKRA